MNVQAKLSETSSKLNSCDSFAQYFRQILLTIAISEGPGQLQASMPNRLQ